MNGHIATVGTFDGVHRGHSAVLDTLCATGREEGLSPLVITFDRHPLEVVAPAKAPAALTVPDRQEELLSKWDVRVVRVPFTERLAALTAGEWIGVLAREYGVRKIVLGYDNTFGCDGVSLSLDDYARLAEPYGVSVMRAPVVDGISSSAVRKAVAAGDVERAAVMLGRPYMLEGIVVHGNALGSTFGWPTANLQPDPRLLVPAPGVYAAEAILPDGREFPAMVNIGTRPTLGIGGRLSVEAHILGFKGSLYSLPFRLRFHSRLRDERKFPSLGHLKEALCNDAEAVKAFFAAKNAYGQKI